MMTLRKVLQLLPLFGLKVSLLLSPAAVAADAIIPSMKPANEVEFDIYSTGSARRCPADLAVSKEECFAAAQSAWGGGETYDSKSLSRTTVDDRGWNHTPCGCFIQTFPNTFKVKYDGKRKNCKGRYNVVCRNKPRSSHGSSKPSLNPTKGPTENPTDLPTDLPSLTPTELYPKCDAKDDIDWYHIGEKVMGNGVCNNYAPYNTEDCGYDGGDCVEFNEDYPNCDAKNGWLVGNGECFNKAPYNTEECGWDGGDCEEFNRLYPNCDAVTAENLGNGYCNNYGLANTAECGWDGGDCNDFNSNYPDCDAENPWIIGNGFCDNYAPYNTAECGYDGGDCPTPKPSSRPSLKPTSSSKPSLKLPSSKPSVVPTTVPSTQPTQSPSIVPSNRPSVVLSTVPSTRPTQLPSSTPSNIPSVIPSTVPSKISKPEFSGINGNTFASHKDVTSFGTTARQWRNHSYATYASVNFGEPGTTKGIKVNYAKQDYGGKMEIRLGGPTGPIIAEFTPAHTSGWANYITAYIGLLDGDSLTGVHDLTFVGKRNVWSFSLAYFELSDFADRTVVNTLIEGTEISTNFGVRFDEAKVVEWFDAGDFVTYSQVNFGAPGTAKGLSLRYSKDTDDGKSNMEVRLGGPTGQLLGEFAPIRTISWADFVDACVELDAEEVDGIHDLTFVGKGDISILNLESFSITESCPP